MYFSSSLKKGKQFLKYIKIRSLLANTSSPSMWNSPVGYLRMGRSLPLLVASHVGYIIEAVNNHNVVIRLSRDCFGYLLCHVVDCRFVRPPASNRASHNFVSRFSKNFSFSSGVATTNHKHFSHSAFFIAETIKDGIDSQSLIKQAVKLADKTVHNFCFGFGGCLAPMV